MNKTRIYYQPVRYIADDNMIEWGDIPEELHSFQAFATREDCEEWLENNGYDACDYAIIAYQDDDIEGVTIIDEYGEVVEVNEDDAPTSKKIYVIGIDDLYEQDADGNDIYPSADELTDEEFIRLSNGWCFDSIEEFINAFNADANDCPVPSQHYMRII